VTSAESTAQLGVGLYCSGERRDVNSELSDSSGLLNPELERRALEMAMATGLAKYPVGTKKRKQAVAEQMVPVVPVGGQSHLQGRANSIGPGRSPGLGIRQAHINRNPARRYGGARS
jgi:hypothetical protein